MVSSDLKHQTNALMRKNLVYQRRRCCVNVVVILLPLLFIGLLKGLQVVIDNLIDTRDNKCGCLCTRCCDKIDKRVCREAKPDQQCLESEDCKAYNDDTCGLQFSDPDQALFCEIPHPASWPAVMKIPEEDLRAYPWRPDAVMFYTGDDPQVADGLAEKMLRPFQIPPSIPTASNNKFIQMAENESTFRGEFFAQSGLSLGTEATAAVTLHIEKAFVGEEETSILTQDCSSFPLDLFANFNLGSLVSDVAQVIERGSFNPISGLDQTLMTPDLAEGVGTDGSTDSVQAEEGNAENLSCVNAAFVPSTVERINRHFFCSFEKARCNASEEFQEMVNRRKLLEDFDTVAEYNHAWDFKSTDEEGLAVDIWYKDEEALEGEGIRDYQRVNLAQNLAADSWLKWVLDDTYSSKLLALMEMPKPETKLRLEFSSFISVLLFTWVVQLFLPVMLVQLVYEKENRLRIMMKMHGLGNGAYWIVTYVYYLLLYILYVAIFLAVGSAVDLAIFRLTDYGVQILFYFLFGNVQIAFAFLLSNLFHKSQTAMVFSFLWTFGTGLLGNWLLQQLIEKNVFYVKFIELIPAFGAYRGFYEMAEYSFRAALRNSEGLTWSSFSDDKNDIDIILAIFVVEWPIFMMIAWYLEQVVSSGTGVHKHPLYFLGYHHKEKRNPKKQASKKKKEIELHETVLSDTSRSDTHVDIPDESEDVQAERKKVDNIPPTGDDEHSIVVRSLRKVFPGTGQNAEKVAVDNLQLAVRRGEVFGLLGPNGAGKTTALNMLVGFLEPTAGSALVDGLNINDSMDKIYDIMGVCPQHNLLWDILTGAEHLLFYARLKGLKGNSLKGNVENALKSVHLFAGGVGDKLVKFYSGGMKRRLSVAISLVGSPQVVYLDEPSTGLDPASRRNLWDVVKSAKEEKAIILTTHSMKEAEVLCDRLGIFVNGRLMVIGNPKELTARYAEYLIFSLITRPEDTAETKALVRKFRPDSRNTYELGGTLVFELPTADVKTSDVFTFMERTKSRVQVLDWGVANATLEEVFIKIATEAGANTDQLV